MWGLIILLVIVLVGWYAWYRGDLNLYLPASWGHTPKSGFVGAYGRTPEMQGCFAFAPEDTDKRAPLYNRCNAI